MLLSFLYEYIYKITTILLILMLIGVSYYAYLLTSRNSDNNPATNLEKTDLDNRPSNSELGSDQSINFRACAMEKFKENLGMMTMKEEFKQANYPFWVGGCNGNWLRPICQAAIAQVTTDTDDLFDTALNDCMIKELY